MMNRIYLDNAATTPPSPEVLREMISCLTECYGNASSIHGTGREARRKAEEARRKVAEALGAQPREICFTSGGSESDNWAILGAVRARMGEGRHIVTTAIEHHAVLHTCQWLEKQGWEVTYLPVDGEGRVDPGTAEAAIRKDTVLVSVMAANNEIGTLQPVGEIGRIARAHGVLFHTDAVQAMGAVPLDADALSADLVSISAHKFHGPKGIGALYIRQGTRMAPLIFGGAQERGLRAGTENLPAIAGMGKAAEMAVRDLPSRAKRISALRDLLIRGIREQIPEARLDGDPVRRLPGNVHFTFPGVDGEALLLRLDLAGIACSGGSACTSGSTEPSHVLTALGMSPEESRGGLRLSLSDQNTEEEIRETLRILPPIVRDLQQ